MSALVLLVDDDAAVRIALGAVITAAGYTVQTAGSGQDAITALEREHFDVVVSDMRLPDLDGIEVIQAAMSTTYPPAVLLLTGYGTLDTAIAALRLGAVDYLLKPCAPQLLLESVARAVAHRASASQQASALAALARNVADIQRQLHTFGGPPAPPDLPEGVIAIGRLSVGRLLHENRCDGQALHLTPTEHVLLRCLAEAAETVVSYSAIVRHTHGYLTSELEAQALLKSHVRNLRRKIGEERIVSVRNIGYRLDAH